MAHWTETVYRQNPDIFRHHLEAERENAADEVADLLALLGEHGVDPDTALDVPCGIGRHGVELAERGVAVTGVDFSDSYLERARELAAERGVANAVRFLHGDMRELDDVALGRGGASGSAAVADDSGDECDATAPDSTAADPADSRAAFDLVLNAWTSFGYYDDETDREILRGLFERTAEDGALVLELVNREGVLGDFQFAHVPEDDERFVVETHEYDPATARMRTERRVFRATDDGYDYEGEMTYDLRLYAPVELAARCRAVGFDDVSLYAGLDGNPLERESTRLVVVAER